jgi:hypothetical protein
MTGIHQTYVVHTILYGFQMKLERQSTNIVRMHQDPSFWLGDHYLDPDINQHKCSMMMEIKRCMRGLWGDAARMETNVKTGSLYRGYDHQTELFRRR